MRVVASRAASRLSHTANLIDGHTLDTDRRLLHFQLGVGQRVCSQGCGGSPHGCFDRLSAEVLDEDAWPALLRQDSLRVSQWHFVFGARQLPTLCQLVGCVIVRKAFNGAVLGEVIMGRSDGR